MDEDAKNLAFGIFSLFLDLDQSVGTSVTGYIKTTLNLTSQDPERYGKVLGELTIIPVVIAIPIYYYAGRF